MSIYALTRVQSFDRRLLPLAVTTIGSFMSILDTTIVNVALPSILQQFDARIEMGQLVLTSYLIALAIVIPLSGFLGEKVGMKRLYMLTLLCFTIGSALCGFAWNLPSLVVFRVIQGLGGGMLQPLGMAIVFSMISPLERARFMGFLGLPLLIAPILGPSFGGYLVEYVSWRAIFWINLPIGLLNVLLAIRLLRETPKQPATPMDTWGFVFAAVAFPCILLGLTEGEDQGWTAALPVALLTIGATALLLFVRRELRYPQPLLRVRLFKNPMFTLALGVQFVMQFSLFGLAYLLPLFLQSVDGWGAAQVGLVLLPQGIASFIAMTSAGKLYNSTGPRPLVIGGFVVMAVTTLLFTQVDQHTSAWAVTGLAALRGVSLGLAAQTISTVAFNTVPREHMPRATSLVNVCQRVYGSVATAILTSVLVIALQTSGAPEGSAIADRTAPVPNMLTAFHVTFAVMTLMTIVGIVGAWFLRDHVLQDLQRDGDGSRRVPKLDLEPVEA